MVRIDLTEDDPSSTSNPAPTGVIDIRTEVGRELTEQDRREMWLSQYRFKLYFASRRARRLRRVVDDG